MTSRVNYDDSIQRSAELAAEVLAGRVRTDGEHAGALIARLAEYLADLAAVAADLHAAGPASGAELAARVTAARAALAGYRREGLAALTERGPAPDWASWAHRLGAELRSVLAAFDWETGDRQYALERIEQIAGGGQ